MNLLKKIEKAKRLINEAVGKYENIAVGCSFGKDSMVLLHLCKQVKPDIKVFSIMADTEFQETYDFEKEMVKEYGLNYERFAFNQEPQVHTDKSLCCGKPKVNATKLAVKDLNAWIAGIRNTEGVTRANFKYIEEKQGLVKINPILEFTETDIWRYLALFNVPVNPKYREGFRSLGCKLCSAPEETEDEEERAGRWKGTKKQCGECGIHTESLK